MFDANSYIQDIKRLLDEKVAEHQGLEYKSDFPKDNFKLEKSVVAFANSNEGHIIIGIKSDKKTNQPISITGIKSKKELMFKEDALKIARRDIAATLQKVANSFGISLNYFSLSESHGYKGVRDHPR